VFNRKAIIFVFVLVVLVFQFLTMANALSSLVCELRPPVSPGDPPAIPDSPFIENLKVKQQSNPLTCVLVSQAFFSRPGSSNWDPGADLNFDKTIDIFDAIIAAMNC
jgi:hypothetical protein